MFTVHCPRHDADVLLFSGNIRRLTNRVDSLELLWECSCGESGVKRFPHGAMTIRGHAA